MVVKKSAADRLARLGKAEQTEAGPLLISGVGDKKSVADHGRYKISLPIHDGQIVELHGLCLDRLTGTFPKYFLGETKINVRILLPQVNRKHYQNCRNTWVETLI